MRLQTKVLVITLLLAVVVAGAVLSLLNSQLNAQLAETETLLARQTGLQARALIRSRLADLERLAVELQPAARAALAGNDDAEHQLPTAGQLATSELNLVVVVSVDGEVRHEAAWHPGRGVVDTTVVAPWSEIAPAGLEYFTFNRVSPGTGIALTPAGPIELSSIAIVPRGSEDGAVRSSAGSLLVGRLVGEGPSSRWERVLLHSIRVQPLPAPRMRERVLESDSVPEVEITSPTEVVARVIEPDASGRRWVEVEIVSRRTVWLSGQANIIGAMLGLVFGGLALTMAFLGTLRFVVLRRVARLARTADAVRQPGDMLWRVNDDSPDEIGLLVRAFNTMLDRLDNQTERIRTTNRELMTALQAKDELLHTLSHELRTPLTTIRGFAERLAEQVGSGGSPDEARAQIERATDHLLALINDLLDLARARAGRLEVSDGPVDVPEVIDDVVALMRVQAEQKQLGLEVQVPDDLPAARGDHRRLTQVLVNLVGNAIKFSDHGTITISAHTVSDSDGNRLAITVTDEGPGIPAARMDEIFEPFARVVSAGTPRPGTGLGLAISREFVTRMNGSITVTSEEGTGSTFTVHMPRMD